MSKRQKLSSLEHSEDEAVKNLQQVRVLVVGAGGLGCEILKNLVASGFRYIDVIDMDTIELTNLNRQFLFSDADIGEPKAKVAVERARRYAPNAHITSHVARIEDMPDAFYEGFHIVVCGLDSVPARRWINAKLVSLCYADPRPSSLRPLIDGGSEGFRGQARVILPGITSCYECTLDLLPSGSAVTYPLCTIASVPRLPEHCIEWASAVHWPQSSQGRSPDLDSDADMQWLFEAARQRAAEFNIEGVTLELTHGVLKRIIPAIASTNAVVAASCCIEVYKLATGSFDPISNFMMYTGDNGVFSTVIELARRADCPVCGRRVVEFAAARAQSLERTLAELGGMLGCSDGLPSLTNAQGTPIYMARPAALREAFKANLGRSTGELLTAEEVVVTHPELTSPARVKISFN